MGNQYDLNLLAKKFFNHRRVNAFPLMRSEKKLYDVLYSEIFESACNISEKSSDYFFRTIIKEE